MKASGSAAAADRHNSAPNGSLAEATTTTTSDMTTTRRQPRESSTNSSKKSTPRRAARAGQHEKDLRLLKQKMQVSKTRERERAASYEFILTRWMSFLNSLTTIRLKVSSSASAATAATTNSGTNSGMNGPPRDHSNLPLKKRRRVVLPTKKVVSSPKTAQKLLQSTKRSQGSSTSVTSSTNAIGREQATPGTGGSFRSKLSLTSGSALSEDTPSPPPLMRAPSINTYSSGLWLMESLSDFTWGSSATSNKKLPPTIAFEKQQRLEECMAVAPPVTSSLKSEFLASFDDDDDDDHGRSDKKLSPASSSNKEPNATAATQMLHSPNSSTDSNMVTLPASLLTGKLIHTPEGIALLLKAADYATLFAASASSATHSTNAIAVSAPSAAINGINSSDTRNKRWTRAEDERLKYAVVTEAGPPHNWKEIARSYFPGTRNSSQVRRPA